MSAAKLLAVCWCICAGATRGARLLLRGVVGYGVARGCCACSAHRRSPTTCHLKQRHARAVGTHMWPTRGGDMLIEVCARVGCAALPLYVPSPYAATAVAPLSVAVRPDENAARCHNATGGARWAAKIRPDLLTRARNAHVLSVRPAGENSVAPSRPKARPDTVPAWGGGAVIPVSKKGIRAIQHVTLYKSQAPGNLDRPGWDLDW